MWARVKGRTENALLRLPFKGAYMFRPGIIVPRFGARSRTALYRIPYMLTRPFLPLLLRAFPNQVLTTDEIGRAMLLVARKGAPKPVLETRRHPVPAQQQLIRPKLRGSLPDRAHRLCGLQPALAVSREEAGDAVRLLANQFFGFLGAIWLGAASFLRHCVLSAQLGDADTGIMSRLGARSNA